MFTRAIHRSKDPYYRLHVPVSRIVSTSPSPGRYFLTRVLFTNKWRSARHSQFLASLAEMSATESPTNGVVATLEKICRLYGLWSIEENAQYFLKFGFYTAEEMDQVSEGVRLPSLFSSLLFLICTFEY